VIAKGLAAATLLGAAILLTACGGHQPSTLTVSVAASLQNAMPEVAAAYEHTQPGTHVELNFGGSGTLEQQIESGAPVDVFFPAAAKPLDTLAAKGLILADTRRDLLRNEIVLVAPRDSRTPDSFQSLTGVKLIALGDPRSVPAGDYGQQVLESLHLWDKVQSKLVLAKDVRQVLSYVETGNADAGIVYQTDARDSGQVRIVAAAPEGSHAPVVYPVAVVKGSRNVAGARAFVSFLGSGQARDIFTRHGYTTVSR
jgi:molybdate transport system substrate-binding protein